MNVKFEDLNCEDVGKMLKLDKSTISAWCRKGYINFQDVSEPGSKRPRYLIPQWEFDRVSKLIRKYGKRNWILYNADSKDDAAAKYWIEQNVLLPQPEETFVEPVVEESPKEEVKSGFDPDKAMKTLLDIQDIKERLEDLEAERNQLLGELKLMKEEINSYI